MRYRLPGLFALLLTLLLNLLLPITSVHAASATERLMDFFTNVQSMQAEFTQTVSAQGFADKETSYGVFQLLRPGKFRWDYERPYQQHIIADGNQLWVYDVDMDQVIVKPLNLVLGQTPAVLLSGNASLTDRFDIQDVPGRDEQGLAWVQLRPKDNESSYEKLLLGFSQQNIRAMELVDNFGQVTLLEFSHLQRNPNIDPSIFQFQPPPGVDVIGEEEMVP
ncbi:MAG: outer membrane lipoprotein chaperone LolA [Gammaproteobacteria bacterium]|jgi:outer membrane lipoprotein carrier protein|nr:outer membrane lipoprotein chaperone LolA [Gammaproteobacteria bacterium]